MLTLLLLLVLVAVTGAEVIAILLLKKHLKSLEDAALKADTPVRLSTAEIEEAGLAGLIRDLAQFVAVKGDDDGVDFFDIRLADLLQVVVQKLRQLNIENADLASAVFSEEKKED
jgi:hypothetical protein